jgi:PEP-CTERM motif-containing protein
MTFMPPTGQYPIGGIIVPGPNGSVSGDGPNSCCFLWVQGGASTIDFTADGQSWGWGGNDMYGGWDFLYSSDNSQVLPVAWNITAVPEPSTLLLLGVSLLSLVGFGLIQEQTRVYQHPRTSRNHSFRDQSFATLTFRFELRQVVPCAINIIVNRCYRRRIGDQGLIQMVHIAHGLSNNNTKREEKRHKLAPYMRFV